jgi:hypothetical protein
MILLSLDISNSGTKYNSKIVIIGISIIIIKLLK